LFPLANRVLDRARRGGDWNDSPFILAASSRRGVSPLLEFNLVGFRVASLPESTTALLLGTALLAFAERRRLAA
jgi:hypothetical protein